MPINPSSKLYDDLTMEIQRLTGRVIRARLLYGQILFERKRDMSRLTDKLKQAASVAPRQAALIEARADAIIAREPALQRLTDEVFTPHEALLNEATRGLDELDASLRQMSNSPLPASGSSPPPLPQADAIQSSDAGH